MFFGKVMFRVLVLGEDGSRYTAQALKFRMIMHSLTMQLWRWRRYGVCRFRWLAVILNKNLRSEQRSIFH
ncbi:hypothetical protein CPH98_28825 [Klebsiella pneumoniae subsp. pneumoniae]|nr:hypothetical protein [Klebsiella pneumoniae subsp. pneumoniae]